MFCRRDVCSEGVTYIVSASLWNLTISGLREMAFDGIVATYLWNVIIVIESFYIGDIGVWDACVDMLCGSLSWVIHASLEGSGFSQLYPPVPPAPLSQYLCRKVDDDALVTIVEACLGIGCFVSMLV